VYARGVRPLIGEPGALPAFAMTPPSSVYHANLLPSQEEFPQLVKHFFLDAFRTVQFLQRQELWRAKQCCDCQVKQALLAMMEWHANVLTSQAPDVWPDGRFLAEWADSRARAGLP